MEQEDHEIFIEIHTIFLRRASNVNLFKRLIIDVFVLVSKNRLLYVIVVVLNLIIFLQTNGISFH